MAMDGKSWLKKLAKLSSGTKALKNVPQLTHALFPGTH